MDKIRCTSPLCITENGVKGRLFTPSDIEGLAQVWCPECIKLQKQLVFFSQQTAEMIAITYSTYINTALPKDVKLVLRQFTRELLQQLGIEKIDIERALK